MKRRFVMKRLLICAVIMLSLVLSMEVFGEDTLQIEGSTTVGPIADAFAERFMQMYPELNITVKKTGSGNGAAALVEKRCDIAAMSRFMKEKEFEMAIDNGVYPVAHTVALDGVCVVVHPSNPVEQLSSSQLRDIYTGEITNWKQVGGVNMPIVVVSRDTASGTYETFHNCIMDDEKMGSDVEYVGSNPQAHARVKTLQGGIGYIGLGFIDRNVKPVKVDGVKPGRGTIASGDYPIARPLFMWTDGYPELGGWIHRFVTFYLTETGQQVVESKGFVPVTNY